MSKTNASRKNASGTNKKGREVFFEGTDLTSDEAAKIVRDGLQGSDYGEFYQEIVETEGLTKTKGEYVSVSVGNRRSGFGFRIGKEERVAYAHSGEFNRAALTDAVKQTRAALGIKGKGRQKTKSKKSFAERLYATENSLKSMSLAEKVAAMDKIEEYVQSLDPDIVNVTLSYSAKSTDVHIINADGDSLVDNRPMAGLSIQVMVKDRDGKTETGTALIGGHLSVKEVFNDAAVKRAAHKAVKQAKTLLIAEEAPAGEMDVVLGPGWSAVLLHEAVGHGLEGDFNRRGISVYSGKVGEMVAGPEVTVIDQGDLPGERGSLHFDDEGQPTQKNVLIKNGVLQGYMQDRQNAQLMGAEITGNGRRESYADLPMPRMTNTYFANGKHDPKDIIKSVKDGLYIEDMGGGQVDITSGKFNMNATLAWRIRDGKLCEPVKGATLVGDGLTAIKNITMVGNDLALEKNAGMCGKNGQSVPVGCGQPTIRVNNMTVGGTGGKTGKKKTPRKPQPKVA